MFPKFAQSFQLFKLSSFKFNKAFRWQNKNKKFSLSLMKVNKKLFADENKKPNVEEEKLSFNDKMHRYNEYKKETKRLFGKEIDKIESVCKNY